MKLSEIYQPIEHELTRVDREFEKELKGYDGFSSTILEFLLGEQGKKLRPALVLLSAKVGGGDSHRIIRFATAVELLHTATLIHDDVLDEALLRRKKMSLNFRWGNEVSVVMGDYLYAKTFIILSEFEERKIWERLTDTAKVICMGELAQLGRRYDFTLTEEHYVSMIERKTASLMASACELGAYLGGAPAEDITCLKQYGLQFGIGFQIIDDCLDLVGDETKMGKSLGTDIRKGKPTLPIILLLEKISNDEKEKLREMILASQDGEAMGEIRRLIERHGTLKRSMEKANTYLETAKREIVSLNQKEVRECLMQLADYTSQRSE